MGISQTFRVSFTVERRVGGGIVGHECVESREQNDTELTNVQLKRGTERQEILVPDTESRGTLSFYNQ